MAGKSFTVISSTDLPKLRARWAQLTSHEQAVTAERCGWYADTVSETLSSTRIFSATPGGDLDALATALGFSPSRLSAADDALFLPKGKRPQCGPDPEAAARQALRLVRPGSLPVDLESVAESMGVKSIREYQSLVDGRLLTGPGGTVVEVSSLQAPARKRFTIAHELGHLWLARHYTTSGLTALDWRAEERFCNEFAAALLMPRAWLVRRCSEADCDFRALELIALEARTSISATIIRLGDLDSRWGVSLLKFRPGVGEAWRLSSITSSYPGMVGRLRCNAETPSLLDAAIAAARPIKGLLHLTLDRRPLALPAEALAGPHRAGRNRVLLVITRLPRPRFRLAPELHCSPSAGAD
jgi:IrrE N-terminal-like domain